MKINITLLRKVKKHILEEPRRLDMNVVLNGDQSGPDAPPCGTIGCIGGWTNFLSGKPEDSLSDAAIRLGLDSDEQGRLFEEPAYTVSQPTEERAGWPEKFMRRYLKAKTPQTRAKVTAERIDHFIKTKGAE